MTAPVLLLNGVHIEEEVAGKLLTLRLTALDFTLMDPTTLPMLGDDVECENPAWTGIVTSVSVQDNDHDGHTWVKVTATNAVVAEAAIAPFGLSDATGDYRRLQITRTLHDGVEETRGSLETFLVGLAPGQTFELTSANHVLAAADFTITDMTVSWLTPGAPLFKVDFGDAMVTMAAWLGSSAIPDGTISGTKITDGSVTTPKLAANITITNLLIDSTNQFTGGQYLRGTAPNYIQMDANGAAVNTGFIIEATSGQLNYFYMQQAGDSVHRLGLRGDHAYTGLELGPGNAAQDVVFQRAGTKAVRISALNGATLTKIYLGHDTNIDIGTVGSLLVTGGDSFPAGPATNDLYYRTDLGGWFYYDATLGWHPLNPSLQASTNISVTADVNNLAPNANLVRLLGNGAAHNITGMVAGYIGELRVITNDVAGSGGALTFKYNSGSSSAGNRFAGGAGGADKVLNYQQTALLFYDGTYWSFVG